MIIIDDYIKDIDILKELKNDKTFFPEAMGGGEKIATELNGYHYEKSDCYAPYMFWDGWWRSPANTLKKRIIKLIWENHLPKQQEEILGFEYWTRTYSPGQYLDLHVDEDTFLYAKDKTFSGPIMGSVYYGCDNPDGGFLEIHPKAIQNGLKNVLEQGNLKEFIGTDEQKERIRYKSNRLIIFNAGHILHNTTPAKSGIRQVMIINVWDKETPPLALSLNEFYYE